jgi:hypothetical protein
MPATAAHRARAGAQAREDASHEGRCPCRCRCPCPCRCRSRCSPWCGGHPARRVAGSPKASGLCAGWKPTPPRVVVFSDAAAVADAVPKTHRARARAREDASHEGRCRRPCPCPCPWRCRCRCVGGRPRPNNFSRQNPYCYNVRLVELGAFRLRRGTIPVTGSVSRSTRS